LAGLHVDGHGLRVQRSAILRDDLVEPLPFAACEQFRGKRLPQFLDRRLTLIGWLAMLVVQVLTAVLAFRLDRERLWPLWTLPLQQIVYRQLMYAVLLHSALTAVTGRRLRWQKMRRTGVALSRAG